MKVAIIYPEVYDIARFGRKRKEFTPFGVLYLATILNLQSGVEVEIFAVESKNDFLDLTEFDVVAFSIPSSVTYSIVKAVRFSSFYSKNALIIAGGVHPTIFPEETLLDLKVDAVGHGQGDETILELLQEKRKRNFSRVKGLCYRENGNMVLTSQRPLKKTLDHLPIIPNRNLLPDPEFILNDRLSNTNHRMTHIMISQGCPFSCNFCASQQRYLQYRSGWHVFEELKYLKETYNIEGFAEVGDNFLVNKRNVYDICEAINPLGLEWSTLSRVDTVDYDLLETMHESGCIEIKFGIESGSELILKKMGKGISLNQIYNAVKMTYASGIKVKVFIIHGFPGENHETTQETLNLLDDLSGMIERISLFRFVPLPGSRVYEKGGEYNLNLEGDVWEKCHIHHNRNHWWGTEDDFRIVESSCRRLEEFVRKKWG
ncbi:MAG: radical SAM protein [Candidatus Moraniibacteriota bacterium]